MTRYGFIGTGSMGSMLIRQFIRTGVVAPQEITACSRTGASACALAAETGIAAGESNRDVARIADVLFICVRPLDVHAVLREIHDVLPKEALLVSIAGCVTLADIAAWTRPAIRCAKIIPSVTAEEHSGIALVAWNSWITPEDKERVFTLFSAIGTPVEIDEKHIEVYSDLTSCAPALFAAMMQEFAAAAVRREGVPPALAEFLVRHTLIGTAWLLTGKETGFEDIIRRVATPGGITEEGVRVLRNGLPPVYDELLEVTLAKHASVKERIAEQSRKT
jgi:pyrroline-5-carboxylate reductase